MLHKVAKRGQKAANCSLFLFFPEVSKKMNDFDTKWCTDLLNKVRSWPISVPFLEKVNEKEYPQYKQIVSKPMDLSTMKMKLEKKKYTSVDEFVKDFELIYDASKLFNGNDNIITAMASDMLLDINQRYSQRAENEKDEWFKKLGLLHQKLDELVKFTPQEFLQDSRYKQIFLPPNFNVNNIKEDVKPKLERIIGEKDLNLIPKQWELYTTQTKEKIIKYLKKYV